MDDRPVLVIFATTEGDEPRTLTHQQLMDVVDKRLEKISDDAALRDIVLSLRVVNEMIQSDLDTGISIAAWSEIHEFVDYWLSDVFNCVLTTEWEVF